MSAWQRLIDRNATLLEQGIRLLDALDDDEYARPIDGQRGSIGTHVRHCAEFYEICLGGIPAGAVDYDARERDPRFERERRYAIERLKHLAARIRLLSGERSDRALRIRSEQADPGDEACLSSPARELRFLLSHTVHHFAIIAIVLRGRGIETPRDFGVAPSTRAHWARA